MPRKNTHNIGLDANPPKDVCTDKNCPFHGTLKVHGKTFVGIVYSSKPQKTAIVEWGRKVFVPKYERIENKRTKITVHNPPCINAMEGDRVKIIETRPLSKTKNFVIVEKLGHAEHFQQEMEAREEAAVKQKVKRPEAVAEEPEVEDESAEVQSEESDEEELALEE